MEESTQERLTQRLRAGQATVLISAKVPAAWGRDAGWFTLEANCGVPWSAHGPLDELQVQAERLVDDDDLLEHARHRMVTGLRRRLLGEPTLLSPEAGLVEACNRLQAKHPNGALVVLDRVESADEATLQALLAILGRPGWLQVPMLLLFRRAPTGAGAEFLEQARALLGADAILEPEGQEAASPSPRFEWRALPPDPLLALRAAALLGEQAEAPLLASLLEWSPGRLLAALQQALDQGAPVEDDGQGRISLPNEVRASLTTTTLPSLMTFWHQRLGTLLTPSHPQGPQTQTAMPARTLPSPAGTSPYAQIFDPNEARRPQPTLNEPAPLRLTPLENEAQSASDDQAERHEPLSMEETTARELRMSSQAPPLPPPTPSGAGFGPPPDEALLAREVRMEGLLQRDLDTPDAALHAALQASEPVALPSLDAPPENAPSENAPSENAPSKEALSEEASPEEASPEEAAPEEASSEGAARADGPQEDAPQGEPKAQAREEGLRPSDEAPAAAQSTLETLDEASHEASSPQARPLSRAPVTHGPARRHGHLGHPQRRSGHARQGGVSSYMPDQGRAAKHLEAAGDAASAVQRYLEAGREAGKRGDVRRAWMLVQEALGLVETHPGEIAQELKARAAMELGVLQWRSATQGTSFTLSEALATLGRARELLGERGDPKLQAELASLIGGVCYDLGDLRSLERALQELNRASRLWMDEGQPIQAARLLNDQAAIHIRLGDPVQAVHLLESSRQVFGALVGEPSQAPEAKRELAETEHLLARLPLYARARAGREADAWRMGLDHAAQAEGLYAELGERLELGRVWETMARLELRQGRAQEALERLARALEVQHKGGDLTGLASTTEAMALALAEQGRYGEAVGLLSESIQLNREKGSPLGLGLNRHALAALVARVQQTPERVQVALQGAFARLEQHLSLAEREVGRVRLPL
jgi:tetratricopeptide (TPR) repeat protein